MENGGAVTDIQSVTEAVLAEDEASVAPLHQVESLCMRCGDNVMPPEFSLFFLSFFLQFTRISFFLDPHLYKVLNFGLTCFVFFSFSLLISWCRE